MHLSTVGQLANPTENGGQRAGRHRDRIVINRHGLPGRAQSDNGGVRLYEWGGGRGDARKLLGSLLKAFVVAPR